jgi:homocysteine S-methyltransferase
VAYPNRGQAWESSSHTWVGSGTFAPGDVRSWIDAGAQLVGGCCRVGADDIAAIADVVASRTS